MNQQILAKMNWFKEYKRYELDQDLQQESDHAISSLDSKLKMKKEREYRCGVVIWSTVLLLVYSVLYMYMHYLRYSAEFFFNYNTEIGAILKRQTILTEEVPNGSRNRTYDELFRTELILEWLETFDTFDK